MDHKKRVAIMQPYVFPYIGYFHLIEASDLFVFYDDVNFITRGWINRNKILLNGKDFLFTIPVKKGSQNKLINEIEPVIDENFKYKFLNQIKTAYKKAPFYNEVSEIIFSLFEKEYNDITDLAINSIVSVYNYLGKSLNYKKSSICAPSTRGMEKADRLIQITKKLGYNHYVNTIGGMALYSKDYFWDKGVDLKFVQSDEIEYPQFNNAFIPKLSVIDILMFNDKEKVKDFFSSYQLI